MRRRYSSNGSDRRERALFLGLVALGVLAVIVARLFFLQVVYSDRSRELSERNWLRPEYLRGPRGRILDRNGVVLADMVPAFSIVMDPHHKSFVRHPERLDASLTRLAELVGGDAEHYRRTMTRDARSSYQPIRLERNADTLMVARVEEHRSELPGVSVEVQPARFYPADSLAAHVLGYVGEVGENDLDRLADLGYRPGSLIGKSGIELQYEDQLRGEDGIRYVEVDALGRRSEVFIRAQPVPPRAGRDLTLTLDAGLQRVMEDAMGEARYDGRSDPPEVRGAGVLMDVRRGEVLAMASRPGFSPNDFSPLSPDDWHALNREGAPLLNRAIQSAYPPGSVFKPITQYALFSAGIIHPGQGLSPCFGSYRFGNRSFRCWKPSGHGSLDPEDAMAQSCDVFFYQVAPTLGVDGIARAAELFGVAQPTGIDLPGERAGLVPDSQYYDRRYGKHGWGQGQTLNLIIGQGEILVTPMELARYTATFAADGMRPVPRLLKELGPEHRQARHPEPPLPRPPTRLAVDEQAVWEVRKGMRAAVTKGTARSVQLPGISIAAKTGTAQNPGYDHALFIAFAPAENPEVALALVFEHRGHGGSVCAPVARKIFAEYFGVTDSLLVQVGGDTD